MKRSFAAYDRDGTLSRGNSLNNFRYELLKQPKLIKEDGKEYLDHKIKDALRSYTERRITYEEAVERVLDNFIIAFALSDLTRKEVEYYAKKFYEKYGNTKLIKRIETKIVDPYVKQEKVLMQITGSLREIAYPFAEAVKNKIPFDINISTEAVVNEMDKYVIEESSDGILVPKFTQKLVTGKDKLKALRESVERNDLTFEGSWGFGDSEGDIDWLDALGKNVVAVNPTPKLRSYAALKGWNIFSTIDNFFEKLDNESTYKKLPAYPISYEISLSDGRSYIAEFSVPRIEYEDIKIALKLSETGRKTIGFLNILKQYTHVVLRQRSISIYTEKSKIDEMLKNKVPAQDIDFLSNEIWEKIQSAYFSENGA